MNKEKLEKLREDNIGRREFQQSLGLSDDIPFAYQAIDSLIEHIDSLELKNMNLIEALQHISVNPYPESLFEEPTDEQWSKAHEYFKSIGFTIDKISGAYGRTMFQWARDLAKKAIEENKNES